MRHQSQIEREQIFYREVQYELIERMTLLRMGTSELADRMGTKKQRIVALFDAGGLSNIPMSRLVLLFQALGCQPTFFARPYTGGMNSRSEYSAKLQLELLELSLTEEKDTPKLTPSEKTPVEKAKGLIEEHSPLTDPAKVDKAAKQLAEHLPKRNPKGQFVKKSKKGKKK